jgi:DNA-binding MarR family transcriptional regulator
MKRKGNRSSEATLLLDVWLVSHLTGRLLDDALRPLGLSGDEFGLYSLIYSFGPVTPTHISRWTGMAPTTVSSMTRRIASRGHLANGPNPDDARSLLLALSDDGLAVTARAAAILAATLPRLEDALDTGQATIRAGLGDLDTGLRWLTDATSRPYGVPTTGRPAVQTGIAYRGPRLTPAQSDEVRTFIDWLRSRDQAKQADI